MKLGIRLRIGFALASAVMFVVLAQAPAAAPQSIAGAAAAHSEVVAGVQGNPAPLDQQASPRSSFAQMAVSVAHTINVGKDPEDILYAPSSHEIYVADYGAKNVSVINGTTYKVVRTISVGTEGNPESLLYNPSNREVYVVLDTGSGSPNGSIVVIDTTTNKVVTTVHVNGTGSHAGPILLAYDPANGDTYALSDVQTSSPPYYSVSYLSKIGNTSNAVTSIKVDPSAINVIYDNATQCLVVAGFETSNLTVVNSTTNSVRTVHLGNVLEPNFMVYNSADKDVDVVDFGTSSRRGPNITGDVSVLAPTNKVVATIKVGMSPNPFINPVDPVNHDLYVVNTNQTGNKGTYGNTTVSIISTSNKVVATVKVGKGAFVAQYDPANGDVYVESPLTNRTYVIGGTTNKLVGSPTISKGYPYFPLFDPGTGDMLVAGESTFADSSSTAKTVVAVFSSANQLLVNLTLGEGPISSATYDPEDSGMFATNYGAGTVSVIL